MVHAALFAQSKQVVLQFRIDIITSLQPAIDHHANRAHYTCDCACTELQMTCNKFLYTSINVEIAAGRLKTESEK